MMKTVYVPWIYILLLSQMNVTSSLTVNSFTLTNEKPEKGSNIIMKCSYTILASDGLQTLAVSKGSAQFASCYVIYNRMASCSIHSGIPNNYYASNSTVTEIEFKISNVQISDGGNWICGFRTQPGGALSLNVAVYVKVTKVTIIDGNVSPQSDDIIEVTENETKTLTCRTGVSIPSSTILWYINGLMKQNGTDVNFVFTPTNDNHNQRIYCKAYNIQPPAEAVVSAKPKLFVKVLASTPSLTNWTSGSPDLFSGEQVTLSCKSSPTRPAVTVKWKKGSSPLLTVHTTTITNNVGLVTVLSTVKFTLQKSDNSKRISCETYITNQSPQKVQQSVSVWWPPTTPSIPTDSFPWLEGQIGKTLNCRTSDHGNPEADVLWASSIGTPASKILNLPKLTQYYHGLSVSCQLRNKHTQKMSEKIQSEIINLDIMYKPDVFIRIGNVERYSVVKNQGDNLTAVCSANGNPVPTVSWQDRTPGNPKLELTDIDRNNHRFYRCSAKASSSSYPGYDFSNETTLDLTVNYEASITSFFIEGHRGQTHVTVDENDEGIQFICEVDSNPASTVKILFHDVVLKRRSNTKQISFNKSHMACLDGGEYTCEGNNQYGQLSKKSIKLFVSCSPRPLHQMRQNITSALHVPVTLSFTALAYPQPGIKGFAWFKENDMDWAPVLSNADLHISSSALQSNLTILNVSKPDYGRYRLTVKNDLGSYVQHLFLHEEVAAEEGLLETCARCCKMETENTPESVIIGIVLGVVVAVLAIYATSISILYKRKITSTTKTTNQELVVRESTQMTYVNVACKPNVQEGPNKDGTTEAKADEAQQYTDLAGYSRDDRTTYEVLQDL